MLVASLFVYRMTVLPMMSNNTLKELQKEIDIFLWNGSRPKISRSVLMQDHSLGGAKLTNFMAKNMLLKVTWVQILQQEAQLKNIVFNNIQNQLGDLIWNCNLSPKDVSHITSDRFWKEVFEAWFTLKKKCEKFSISNQMVWYNSSLLIDNKPIFWRKCFQKGLTHVKQLYRNKILISCKEAFETYGLDIMSFNSLVSAIPKDWRALI